MIERTKPVAAPEELSPWWPRSVLLIMIFGFSMLILMSLRAIESAPPIPGRAVNGAGETVFTGDDVLNGQAVFLKYGLMNNGTIWGHGGYLGPDFSAETLHGLALAEAERIAQQRFRVPYANLDPTERSAVDGAVASIFKKNRYDPGTGTLVLPGEAKSAFEAQVSRWKDYFSHPTRNGGLRIGQVADPQELRELVAFFTWTAWAAAAERPGKSYSYTNNFPHDPLVNNHPTSATVMWSAISLIFLLAGIAVVLLAFGRFDYLGWHGGTASAPPAFGTSAPLPITRAQIATFKFMGTAALLFLAQVLIGGALAHYRADPGEFYGFDLASFLPSNLLRGWHLQLAVFWIATAFVGGALYVASALGRGDPPGQRPLVNVLYAALVVVVVGSLLGQWAGIRNMLGEFWFWFGNQGWEYLEIGRFWQILLAVGLVFWFGLVFRAVIPASRDRELRPFVVFFLISAFAIPFFYLPAFFIGAKTHYSVADVWRFWLIHLWVEGFFEFFVTVIVAVILYQLGLVRRITAIRVIYLDAVLYFGGGIIGTAHHWYFTGQTTFAMALGATISALEVVPVTLLTLDAWDFYRLTRGESASAARHRWTFFFLMAVGFWNFTGAGVFGFLINTPIVSYYEVGTNLTVNHGHAAFIGVFGMLGVGLMVYVLREVVADAVWERAERWVKIGFWGLNAGLAMMVVFSLLPNGILQVWDVIDNGYWHARSPLYTQSPLPKLLEWMRMPGDMVFIFAGVLPLVVAMAIGYLSLWRRPRVIGSLARPA